jgi:tetratricopeptide (TPR) repeat protein
MAMTRPAGRFSSALLALTLLGAGQVTAQSPPKDAPRRPQLATDRDTNSAASYFYYASAMLDKAPERAEAGFYWAARLDPYWADPLYGEFIATLLGQNSYIISGYLARREKTIRDPVVRHIDSLAYLALMRNPFVDRRFDGVMLDTWLNRETHGQATLRDLRGESPRFAGWLAYTYGHFEEAATQYAVALKKYPDDPTLQLQRALPFVALGLNDSALTAVRSALAMYRGPDTSHAMHMYESHAFAEYSLGVLFERGEQSDSAQAAYERSLLDDITFYPAHRKLARLRLAAGDTSRAMREYADAVALAPGDAVALYEFGVLTMAAGRADSAVMLLQRASAAEPFFAKPHSALGLLYEHSGFVEEASGEYETFLRLAPRSMTAEIDGVRRRLAGLSTSPAQP